MIQGTSTGLQGHEVAVTVYQLTRSSYQPRGNRGSQTNESQRIAKKSRSPKVNALKDGRGVVGYLFSFDEAETISVDEYKSGLQSTVVPVLFRSGGTGGRIEGTAFCIAVLTNGEALFATARHVVEKLDEEAGIEPFLCLPRLLEDGQTQPNLVGIPIHQICIANTNSDVALLVIDQTVSRYPVEPLKWMELSLDEPEKDSLCMAVGYPQSTGDRSSVKMMASRGVIEEVHPNKRDSVLSNFPSFQTTGLYKSGMSGSPIFDSKGYIMGVVSHGIESDDSGLVTGYGATIAGLLELRTDLHRDDGDIQEFTFPDLIEMRVVHVKSQQDVTLSRDDNGVTLNWA